MPDNKSKDAFNRKGAPNQNPKENAHGNPEIEKPPKDKPDKPKTDDASTTTETPNTSTPSGGGKLASVLQKGKDMAVSSAKSAAKSKVRNSDSETGKIYRAYEKTKAAVMKTRKYTGWLVKYVKFCVSNPVGWVCGIITIYVLASATTSVATSMKEAADSLNNVTDSQINDESNTDGEKATIILMSCGTRHSSKPTGETSSDVASDADWTKEGTTAYKNAKAVFNAWVNAGLSGEAAAGIVGWVNSEGGFDVIGRAEGHYGGGLSDSIAHGAVPIPSTNKYAVGGGGIYQFTPYTNYAPLNDPKWEDGEAMTKYVISLLPGSWIPEVPSLGLMHDMTGTPHTFEQFAQETDPTQATLMWNSYERGDQAHIRKEQKQADAKKANEVFNKEGHKFDRAKFDSNFGASKSSDGSSSSSSSNKKKVKCGVSTGGGKGWQAKGGSHSYSNGQGWRPEELPNDLKQYAIDPKSLGITYNKSDGWDPIKPHSIMHDQCTGLSATLMHYLWQKDGRHPTQLQGNGNQVVNNWVATYGGSQSSEPTSGAVFSTPGPGDAGHTGVVSHVFDDGSILIVEQNVGNLSGEACGLPFTWDYRIVSADAIKSQGYSFYNPGDNGFEINDQAKSLA
jgi:conserved hypothetical secreted protein